MAVWAYENTAYTVDEYGSTSPRLELKCKECRVSTDSLMCPNDGVIIMGPNITAKYSFPNMFVSNTIQLIFCILYMPIFICTLGIPHIFFGDRLISAVTGFADSVGPRRVKVVKFIDPDRRSLYWRR
jgi:hypothetical protein